MLAVKVKNDIKKNEKVVFEVITRSPFNGYNFEMEADIFKSMFSCENKAVIQKNETNKKENIYSCSSHKFPKKLEWWNKNIYEVAFLHKEVYSSKEESILKAQQLDMFNTYMFQYKEDLGETYPVFLKDLKLFSQLFDSSIELYKEASDEDKTNNPS
jgi:hypothetical protein